MVGLPARGKSYIAKMVQRYLKWTGYVVSVFNVGSYRRKIGLASADSNFFDEDNHDAQRVRDEMAMAVQDEMYNWLRGGEGGGEGAGRRVAIFDATNTTKSRRQKLLLRARREAAMLLFVESICDDKNVLERNYAMKLQNDDYRQMDPTQALKDFKLRVEAYEKVYEPLDDDEDGGHISYIKLINVGQKITARYCTGYLPSQVAFYLQNIHIQPRKIYLSLNAENSDLVEDSAIEASTLQAMLTPEGRAYANALERYMASIYPRIGDPEPETLGADLLVLSGTARIHAETLRTLGDHYRCHHTPLLNELRWGDLHNLGNEEIKARYPLEYEKKVIY
jgi:hypothetical protein